MFLNPNNSLKIFDELAKTFESDLALAKEERTVEFVLNFDRSMSMMGTEEYIQKGIERLIKSLQGKKYKFKVILTMVLFCDSCDPVFTRVPVDEAEPFKYQPLGATSLFDAVGGVTNFIKEAQLKDKEVFDAHQDTLEEAHNRQEDREARKFEQQENEKALKYKEQEDKKKIGKKRIYQKQTYERNNFRRKQYRFPDVNILTYTDGMENSSMLFDMHTLASLVDEREKDTDSKWRFYVIGDFCLNIRRIAGEMSIPASNTLSFVRDEEGFKNLFNTTIRMGQQLAIEGKVHDFQRLSNYEDPLKDVKDPEVKDKFSIAKDLLYENEDMFANLEKLAIKSGFNEEFRDLYSKIMLNNNKLKAIIKDLQAKKEYKLFGILQMYMDKNIASSKRALGLALNNTAVKTASVNNIDIGSLRLSALNIIKFKDFQKTYELCLNRIKELESLLGKAVASDIVDVEKSIYNIIESQKQQLQEVVSGMLEERRIYFRRSIKSSSLALFGRDKDNKMNFVQALLFKISQGSKNVSEDLVEVLAYLQAVSENLTINSDFGANLIEIYPASHKQFDDDRIIKAWIKQIQFILGIEHFPNNYDISLEQGTENIIVLPEDIFTVGEVVEDSGIKLTLENPNISESNE